jgi:hypothetical protein
LWSWIKETNVRRAWACRAGRMCCGASFCCWWLLNGERYCWLTGQEHLFAVDDSLMVNVTVGCPVALKPRQ